MPWLSPHGVRISWMPEVKVPTIPGAGTKLSIGRWFRRVGDRVTVHESLVEPTLIMELINACDRVAV
jgi:hypothetical protein